MAAFVKDALFSRADRHGQPFTRDDLIAFVDSWWNARNLGEKWKKFDETSARRGIEGALLRLTREGIAARRYKFVQREVPRNKNNPDAGSMMQIVRVYEYYQADSIGNLPAVNDPNIGPWEIG